MSSSAVDRSVPAALLHPSGSLRRPLADANRILAAGYAGRALNVLITMGLVAAVMWAASTVAPGRHARWLAAGTVAALYPVVVQTGGTVYNDNLFATWTALLVGLTARMVRRACSVKLLCLFALVSTGPC